ncbi:MAG: hypothetical protein ACTSR8_13005 [Promethearchaeota archaeon]
MKQIINAFILSMVLFTSLYLGIFLPILLYVGLKFSKTASQRSNALGMSLSKADGFSTPITLF